ncbi:MAG: nucleotidyltransferase domain-containing protein, partial [Novosphingobium sp.]|nr:nucleotidyltransferase domain-containing protein [Novosphingobium sp.]
MISEQTLSSWSFAPEATKYKLTHEQIREALSKYLPNEASTRSNFILNNANYDVYLQGSYANSTNIKVDSDVDVVIELKTIFSYNIDNLTEIEKNDFHTTYPNLGKYTFDR